MQHAIPIDELGPQGEAMAQAVEACVHCGFCLPTCPTYLVLGEEMDSPRGRIVLMKGALEGDLPLDQVLPHTDRCLGCLACVTACPSGVAYGDLLTPFRELTESQRDRTPMDRLTRRMVAETLPHPGRFRAGAALGKVGKAVKGLLPEKMATMLDLLPDRLPPTRPLPAHISPVGKRRARVALLTGCVQQALAPQINWATAQVLARNGVEVFIPQGQGCCGALSMHTGDAAQARRFARHNFAAFSQEFELREVDAVITNAAGCGSGMHEYPLLFAGRPEAEQATGFAAKVRDISQFLDELGLLSPPPLPQPMTVAYHDACHLAHAQGIREAPRRLLAAIPNLTLRTIAEAEICCGSAGTYNIEQPQIAHTLGQRKASHILDTGADLVVTGNIGCLTQLTNHLGQSGASMPVMHTVEVLWMAYESPQI
jgi:glycolate oxidase iron-sulfur subunit